MDPRDFLHIANQFHASNNEAERRVSIGRAYYTLYNVLIVELGNQGITFRGNAGDHGRLCDYLIQCGHKPAARIGQALRDLRVDRNIADYDMKMTIDILKSRLVYQQAQRALNAFDALKRNDLAQIVLAIQSLPKYP